jgi:hypothetical protein
MKSSKPSETAAWALITGASAGLGAEYARQLAEQGYHLVLTARRLEKLIALSNQLEKRYGVTVQPLSADLSQDEGIRLVEQRIRELPDLEILVNNAGFGLQSSFETNSVEDSLRMIQVHINAAVRLAHAVLPNMRRRKQGWIINVSSLSAFLPVRNVSYSATKAFLVNFSEALETDLIGSGVHAQALCPGFTHTEFHDSPGLSEIRRTLPAWLWMKADNVVRDSLRSLPRNTVIVVPGWHYKIAYFLARSPLFSHLMRAIVIALLSNR